MNTPGAGLVVLASTLALAGGFFAWGAREPPLDEVWRIELELQLGARGPLSRGEIELVEGALARYPGLAEDWIGAGGLALVSRNEAGLVENGYAYFLRNTPDAARVLEVTAADTRADKPIPVEVRAGADEARGELRPGAPFTWTLPARTGTSPEVVEVRVGGKKKKKPAVVVRARTEP